MTINTLIAIVCVAAFLAAFTTSLVKIADATDKKNHETVMEALDD